MLEGWVFLDQGDEGVWGVVLVIREGEVREVRTWEKVHGWADW